MNKDLLGLQVVAALTMLAGLPVGLALWTWRPAWLESMRIAAGSRRTATVLCGAGLLFLAAFAVAACASRRPLQPVALLLVGLAAVNGYAGLAAGAWAQGRAMLRREDGLGCLTWGWLARSSMVLVPLVGIAAGAYFAALAFGTPFVAWRQRNVTTAPSDGSTPAN